MRFMSKVGLVCLLSYMDIVFSRLFRTLLLGIVQSSLRNYNVKCFLPTSYPVPRTPYSVMGFEIYDVHRRAK